MKFEIKYVVSMKQGLDIIDKLSSHMRLDHNVKEKGFYHNNSLYFDNDNFKYYTETREGYMVRKKFRLRRYNLNDDEIHFEVKKKHNRCIAKDRVIMSYDTAIKCIKNPTELKRFPKLEKYSGELLKYRLQPIVSVSYDRIPLEDIFDGKTRITLDYNIRGGPRDKFMRMPNKEDPLLIDHGYAVLEVKFYDKTPIWVVNAIKNIDPLPESFSKYCNAIEATQPFGALEKVF